MAAGQEPFRHPLMKIVTDFKAARKLRFHDLVLAVGNFDGIHLGHQAILGRIRDRAQEIKGAAAVFTFREHPQRVLHAKEEPPILTSLVHKLYLLNAPAWTFVCWSISQKSFPR